MIAGSVPELGMWSVQGAIRMNHVEGDNWEVQVSVPGNKNIEYKYFIMSSHGNVTWELGQNIVLNSSHLKQPKR